MIYFSFHNYKYYGDRPPNCNCLSSEKYSCPLINFQISSCALRDLGLNLSPTSFQTNFSLDPCLLLFHLTSLPSISPRALSLSYILLSLSGMLSPKFFSGQIVSSYRTLSPQTSFPWPISLKMTPPGILHVANWFFLYISFLKTVIIFSFFWSISRSAKFFHKGLVANILEVLFFMVSRLLNSDTAV